MEQRRNKRHIPPQRPADRTGRCGFTLIEVMVVIVIMGVLTSLVSVNWSSFMRHQELRQDAINLHKEILALKARAIEQDTLNTIVTFAKNGNTYTIRWFVIDTNLVAHPKSKKVDLNSGVTISAGDPTGSLNGLPPISSNNWVGSAQNDSVRAIAHNVDAFNDGRIVIKSSSAKARYCIQKDNVTGIRPELYYQSKENGTWSRM